MKRLLRKRLKQLLILVEQFVPANWWIWLGKTADQTESLGQAGNLALKLSRLGLYKRDATIPIGLAAGLRFNVGNSNPDYALGTNERPIQEILEKYLNLDSIFYDIGANVGFFSIIAARLVGISGRVYAFEPEQENAACIRHNLHMNCLGNVTLIEKAVASSSGLEKLILAEHAGGHTLANVGMPPDPKDSVTVEIVSIDDLITQQEIAPPTFVKIDVEGAELEVLRGMVQTIQTYRPILLYEVDDWSEEVCNRKARELEAFIQGFGYHIVQIEDAYPEISWNVSHAIAIPKDTKLAV